MEDTKVCPYCAEEIKAAAKKCKHCGEWLVNKKENSPPLSSEEKDNQPSKSLDNKEVSSFLENLFFKRLISSLIILSFIPAFLVIFYYVDHYYSSISKPFEIEFNKTIIVSLFISLAYTGFLIHVLKAFKKCIIKNELVPGVTISLFVILTVYLKCLFIIFGS